MLVVDPHVQRSGAGKAMVEAIIDHAKSLDGIKAVALTTGRTWESAHGLYRKTGFHRVPERDWFVPGHRHKAAGLPAGRVAALKWCRLKAP